MGRDLERWLKRELKRKQKFPRVVAINITDKCGVVTEVGLFLCPNNIGLKLLKLLCVKGNIC